MAERNLNFDEVVDRKDTDCLKYDFAVRRGKPEDVLPLWVADMDFKVSSYVEDALIERVKHGVFGYSESREDYFEAVASWQKKRRNWTIEPEWLIKTPGVVFALAMAVKAYTEPGDCVLIQQPVYYPFTEVIVDNERCVVSSDLVFTPAGTYEMDFVDFEAKIVENKVKLFLLCSPHNPVGRVWTKEELLKIGEICLKHHVTVVSDEIHHDFIFKGEHHVFADLSEELREISVVCTSPSKTFNLASMLISNILIPNTELRKKFQKQVDAAGISQLSALSLEAVKASYTYGEEWYQGLMAYLKDNIAFTEQFVKENMPGVRMIENQGTYLVWLDFREAVPDVEELDRRIIYDAKLWLDSGKIFGDTGKGFQRINVACPKSVLKTALNRLAKILE